MAKRDRLGSLSHMEYLEALCSDIVTALKEKISAAAEALDESSRDTTCQEVMQHGAYCKKKATTFMVCYLELKNLLHSI